MKRLMVPLGICTLMLGSSTLVENTARAATAAIANDTTQVLRIPRGGKLTLALDGVTRVVPEDDDITRARFVRGKAVLEGVTEGVTRVEIYQGDFKRQLFAVQVEDASSTSANEPQLIASTPATDKSSITVGDAKPISNAPVSNAPAKITTVAALGDTAVITPAAMQRSNLAVSMRVAPAEDNPNQALFTISYANRGATVAEGVVVRYELADETISYVTGSATGDARYDAAARRLEWKIGSLQANSKPQTLSFRVQPVEQKPITFYSVATIEDASGVLVPSNEIRYSTSPTPLLSVFSLPDRILAGRNAPVMADVKGVEFQTAIDRLQRMNVLTGNPDGNYHPSEATQRAEYTVMTLKGLNLRDLRDVAAIKFVLGRSSKVSLNVLNAAGKTVAALIKGDNFDPGEHTVVWDGRSGVGYAAPGRYTYVCTAKDNSRGETTTLRGQVVIVPQNPLQPVGKSSFVDVKPAAWYSGYLAIAEKQDLVRGYPGKLFRPERPISRVEATAVIVRAIGLQDLATRLQNTDAAFLDYQDIPAWARGYINVASAIVKTNKGKAIVRGYPSNLFYPLKPLRRDEAALIVQRLIDQETIRSVTANGQLAPGALLTLNGKTVEPADDGSFQLVLKQNTAEPITLTVLDKRSR